MVVAALAAVGPIAEGAIGQGRGWTIGLLLMLIAPSLARAGGPRFHPMDPETYIPACYFLSTGYTPLLGILKSADFSLSTRDAAAMQLAYAGAIGCALACTALSRVWEPPNVERMVPLRSPRALLDQDWGAIAVGAVGLALVGAWLASVGLGRIMTVDYGATHLEEDGKGLLTSGWYLIRFALVYCFLRFASLRKVGLPAPKVLLLVGACLLGSILFQTMMGRRGPLVWTALSIVLAFHAYGIQLRRLWLAVGVVGALFYGVALEGARAQQGRGFDAQIASAILHLEQKNLLEVNEFERVYDNIVIVANDRPPILEYPGESWINAALILVPRPVWGERPLAVSQRYVNWIAPDFARHGGGFAMNAAAEGFLNLGLLGAGIEVAVFCALFFMHPINVAAGRDTPLLIRTGGACLTSFAYNQFRGELTGVLKITVSLGIALLGALLFTTVVRHLRRRLSVLGPSRRRPLRNLRNTRLGQPSTPGG
ncbi:hypothetical protein SOCE26_086720 [Sorangium cellulosum]|uniref:Oligosaccharide repeat unit polymerase n=1 Tax=Sorangium cellulosum TaxID=56 RepID=A0A2L0F6H2_SORCE|nr:hypothetical protein [Sorangium cellulosum]AUX47160.1 hypothetical protein SOCE26_086720 [Sorangium cellulosum]